MAAVLVPQLLLIAGTGRNSGKTSVACSIIRKFSSALPITALKVSKPHHAQEPGGKIWLNEEGFYVIEELHSDTGKDSSRMLEAGADRSFFIMVDDDKLDRIIPFVFELVGRETMLICESGSMRKHYEPGIFILVGRTWDETIKSGTKEHMDLPHIRINFNAMEPDLAVSRMEIFNGQWVIKQNNDIV